MKTMMFRALCTIVGCLLVAVCSAPAFAQSQAVFDDTVSGIQHNTLMIHGRHSPCLDFTQTSCPEHEKYGVFSTDQANYWTPAHVPHTGARVLYVQWDAWNKGFDSTEAGGGQNVISHAADSWCNFANHQSCRVICHSAGCAAFENYLAKSNYATNSIFFGGVIAAGSAAGGSELAGLSIFGLHVAPIDNSLKPVNARRIYDHNNMQGVPIRAIAGTGGRVGWEGDLEIFPHQGDNSGTNPDCQQVFFNTESMCSDGTVALHSSCGHNRTASFQDCNSTLPDLAPPFHAQDFAGTYDFHGWWINDTVCVGGSPDNCPNLGPYSDSGSDNFNSRFHTYRLDHGGTRDVAGDEYNACHVSHPKLCP